MERFPFIRKHALGSFDLFVVGADLVKFVPEAVVCHVLLHFLTVSELFVPIDRHCTLALEVNYTLLAGGKLTPKIPCFFPECLLFGMAPIALNLQQSVLKSYHVNTARFDSNVSGLGRCLQPLLNCIGTVLV